VPISLGNLLVNGRANPEWRRTIEYYAFPHEVYRLRQEACVLLLLKTY
jgi:hypothetical protein